MLRIGMVGTFDVANFGDLLFPLIARHELERRLGPVTVCPFSYHARSAPSWPFDVMPLEKLGSELPSLDLLLVGGGDIIRFDRLVAPRYHPVSSKIHHPTGFWLGPILQAHAARVPVVWNAPGLPHPIPDWARPLARAGVAVSAYVSVRDEASRDLIEALDPGRPVAVVPDTAFAASSLLTDSQSSEATASEQERLELTPASSGEYLVVQNRPEARRWLGELSSSASGNELSLFRRCRKVLTPVAPGVGDLPGPPRRLPVQTTFCPRLDPLRLLNLIAGSSGVMGTSLHLTIAALALGRPVVRPRSARLRKYQLLDGLDGIVDLDANGRRSPRDRRGNEMRPYSGQFPDSLKLAEIRARLRRHWDAIADLARGSDRPRPPRSGTPLLLELWERMPATLEERSVWEKLRTTMGSARAGLRQLRYNRVRG